MFDATENGLASLSSAFTDGLHDGSLRRYLAIFVATTLVVGGADFLGGEHLPGTRPLTPAPFVAVLGWLLLLSARAAILGFHRNRLLPLVVVGLVGSIVSVAFFYLSAPDLALTH